jgi:hypothetical protein
MNIQNDITNRLELAKRWGITERDDPIYLEIARLMDEKDK